jgi:hypothetical protein
MFFNALGSFNLPSSLRLSVTYSLNIASSPRRFQFTFPAPAVVHIFLEYSLLPLAVSTYISRPSLMPLTSKYILQFLYTSPLSSCFPGSAVHACSSYNSRFQTLIFTTRSFCNLVLPLAHRDWQRSPRSGAVAAAFTKLRNQWMYIIKTCSLTVSYNLTTDIGKKDCYPVANGRRLSCLPSSEKKPRFFFTSHTFTSHILQTFGFSSFYPPPRTSCSLVSFRLDWSRI